MRQFVATTTIEALRKEYDDMKRLKDAEIERLTKGWEGLEYETSAQIASLAAAVNTMHKEAIEQEKHIAKLQAALKEIRDVARCSDGVDFYAMLAEQALEGDDG
jgi:hypothetical protein